MSSVESGRIGPKLVSSPNLQDGEDPESICYCPECGARVRLVTPEPKHDVDRSTLPDWLPPSSAAPTLATPEIQTEPPTPVMSPVSAETHAPALVALPLLTTRPVLPALPSFPSPTDDDDEPTRIIADHGIASAISKQTSPEKPVGEIRHQKPPPPHRQHGKDSVSQLQAHSAPAPLPQQPLEAAPAATASSDGIDQPPPAKTDTTPEIAQPSPKAHAIEAPPPASNEAPHVGVQSTSPTAMDLSEETSERRRPRRMGVLLAAGLGGCAVALTLAFSMRGSGSSRAPTQAAAAIPVAAITPSKVQSITTVQSIAPNSAPPPASEPAVPSAPATSAKSAKPKPVLAVARETEQRQVAAAKSPVASVTDPTAQEPKDEPADELEPFDAREAAGALDDAAERASACRREDDQSGVATVTVTFAPSGRVTTATLSGPPFLGTPTGSCIASTMRSARISAFSGKHVTVRKTVTIH